MSFLYCFCWVLRSKCYICRAPSLKSLHLVSCYTFSDEALTEAIVKFHLLEELELALCSNVGGSGVLGVVGEACPQLKSFRLIKDVLYDSEASDYDKDDEAMGIATMRGLRSLQLFGNGLTNKGLTAILDNCCQLEFLDIRHCFNVYMDNTLRTKCARISTLWLILPKLGDVGMREQFIRPQASDRGFPRIISSSSMDSQGDLSAVENQVRKLIDDLRSNSIECQRSATSEIRLLAKHNYGEQDCHCRLWGYKLASWSSSFTRCQDPRKCSDIPPQSVHQ